MEAALIYYEFWSWRRPKVLCLGTRMNEKYCRLRRNTLGMQQVHGLWNGSENSKLSSNYDYMETNRTNLFTNKFHAAKSFSRHSEWHTSKDTPHTPPPSSRKTNVHYHIQNHLISLRIMSWMNPAYTLPYLFTVSILILYSSKSTSFLWSLSSGSPIKFLHAFHSSLMHPHTQTRERPYHPH